MPLAGPIHGLAQAGDIGVVAEDGRNIDNLLNPVG